MTNPTHDYLKPASCCTKYLPITHPSPPQPLVLPHSEGTQPLFGRQQNSDIDYGLKVRVGGHSSYPDHSPTEQMTRIITPYHHLVSSLRIIILTIRRMVSSNLAHIRISDPQMTASGVTDFGFGENELPEVAKATSAYQFFNRAVGSSIKGN